MIIGYIEMRENLRISILKKGLVLLMEELLMFVGYIKKSN